jgi:O-antigen ligase
MRKRSRPGASRGTARRSRPNPPGTRRRISAAWSVDGIAFAIFAAYLVLALTWAFPEQFALPKLLGLYGYVVFCALRWALAPGKGRITRVPPALSATTLALAVWWIATTLTARHLPTALFGMHGRYNGLTTMLAGLALFITIASTRMAPREVEQRLGAICVALAAASVYALVQALGFDVIQWPEGRPPSTLGHPVILGGVLAMALPFSVAFVLDGRSPASRRAWGAVTVVQGLALALTLARGAWAGALVGLCVFSILAVRQRRVLGWRLAAVAVCAALAVMIVLVVSVPTRTRVLERVSTIASLTRDSSINYRVHFYRAALAMLRDHPWVGVGWENFGLVYPGYRSAPTQAIVSDLVPTMVHSGPLQTAVSGGVPALALQILFFTLVGVGVIPRMQSEPDHHQRLIGAAFVASAIAYLVQDLTGWPHVALGALAFVIWGLAVAWSSWGRPAFSGHRWPVVLLACAIAVGGGWMVLDTLKRIRAERLMFEAQNADGRGSWTSVERKLRAAVDLSPDKAWANEAAARLCLGRVAATGNRRAYEWGVELANAAREANRFDPYVRLRRAELDDAAVSHRLIGGVTDDGREALAAAKAMTSGSAVVQRVEASVLRKTGRIVWVEPQASAGFGPEGSLVVAGSAPGAPAGTRIYLHWRNLTRASAWIRQPDAVVPDGTGIWYNSIPDANVGERYEVYATSETWSYGPCAYTGDGAARLCAPLALIGPDLAGAGPSQSLLVAGSVPEASVGPQVFLHWRNETRQSAWSVQAFRGRQGVSFPPDAPGNWYSFIPSAVFGERYQVYLSSPTMTYEPCTYTGDGRPAICAPIGWIQPQATAGFGPPGSLVVAGFAPEALAGAPVFMHWRNATRGSAWTMVACAPALDGRGTWYNAIPNAKLNERYEVYVTAATATSGKCIYAGDGLRNLCM